MREIEKTVRKVEKVECLIKIERAADSIEIRIDDKSEESINATKIERAEIERATCSIEIEVEDEKINMRESLILKLSVIEELYEKKSYSDILLI